MAKLTNLVTGTASAISRLPSLLIGLAIIVVLAGGAYGAWRVVSHCSGQSLGECFLSAINPFDKSYGRGVGEPLGCADNEEMNAGLCYPKCQVGYKGVGPVCLLESCPSGFRDDGALCGKPESYGRGAGYAWQIGDTPFDDGGQFKRCTGEHGAGNCEKNGPARLPEVPRELPCRRMLRVQPRLSGRNDRYRRLVSEAKSRARRWRANSRLRRRQGEGWAALLPQMQAGVPRCWPGLLAGQGMS